MHPSLYRAVHAQRRYNSLQKLSERKYAPLVLNKLMYLSSWERERALRCYARVEKGLDSWKMRYVEAQQEWAKAGYP